MDWNPPRHRFLRTSVAVAGVGLLQAYGTDSVSQPVTTNNPQRVKPVQPISSSTVHHGDNILRVIAPSDFAESIDRVNIGLTRLYNTGFTATNQKASPHRYQHLAGTDAQHIVGFQDIIAGRAKTPKVSMRLRGGYGAARILPHIDFASLGTKMREHGTLFLGSSDIRAIQLALLAKNNVLDFAGPMVYSEFGRPRPSTYMMDSFVRDPTSAGNTVNVPVIQRSDVNAGGTFRGGNLSVPASLTSPPYMSDIQGGILFIEDVGEQLYRIECMLNMLYLAEVLQKQRTIVLGDLRMGIIRDTYDFSYDFLSAVSQIQYTTCVPVLAGLPFNHIVNKSIFPPGAYAKIRSSGSGGYSVTFSGYPTLNTATPNLNSLLPSPITFGNYVPVGNGTTEEMPE